MILRINSKRLAEKGIMVDVKVADSEDIIVNFELDRGGVPMITNDFYTAAMKQFRLSETELEDVFEKVHETFEREVIKVAIFE